MCDRLYSKVRQALRSVTVHSSDPPPPPLCYEEVGGGVPYNTEVFLEIPHDGAGKNLDVFIFPVSTNMCRKTTA